MIRIITTLARRGWARVNTPSRGRAGLQRPAATCAWMAIASLAAASPVRADVPNGDRSASARQLLESVDLAADPDGLLKNPESVSFTLRMVPNDPQGPVATETRQSFIFAMPDRFYLEIEALEKPSGNLLHRYRKYIDGSIHWEAEHGEARVRDSSRHELDAMMHTFYTALGLHRGDHFDSLALGKSKVEVNGKPCQVVVGSKGDAQLSIFVDPATHRILRLVGESPAGRQAFEISEFKVFDGVTIGTKARSGDMEITIENLAIDQEIDETLFVAPKGAQRD